MKVKLLTSRVGTGFVQEAGEVIDLPPHEAERMIRAEQAEAINDQPQTAMVGDFETASRKAGKPRKAVRV